MRKASELTAVIKRRLVDEESAGAVQAFETFFYGWLARAEPALLTEIRTAEALSPHLREAVTRAVQGAKRERDGTPKGAPESYREDGGES